MEREKLFYNALEQIFLGADIKGDGGYVNLLKIKSRYYKFILSEFQKEVNSNQTLSDPTTKEEFFDRLYSLG
jgi:hypothetical protein